MPPAKEAQNNMPMAMIMGPSITMGMASMSVSMLLGMVMWPIITKKHEKKESQPLIQTAAYISVTAAKKGEWKKYEKTFTIESKAVDSYIKVYVDGTK